MLGVDSQARAIKVPSSEHSQMYIIDGQPSWRRLTVVINQSFSVNFLRSSAAMASARS